MAKRVIHSFNSGEVTPKLKGRTDFNRYFNACLTLKNYLLESTGIANFRPGTEFINATKNTGVSASRLIPFVFSADIAYILELGELYIRFYRDSAVLGAPFEVTTPYLAVNLEKIQYTQSADVMYLVDGINKPRKLSRIADTNWTLTEAPFKNGPFLTANLDETLTLSPGYPAWLTATSYTKNDVVSIANAAINPPLADTLDNFLSVDDGSGNTELRITGHPFAVGQSVKITGSSNHSGTFVLQAPVVNSATDWIRILDPFATETPAGTETVEAVAVDKGSGLVGIPTDPNTFGPGARVTLSGFAASAYNASFELHNSSTTTEIVIAVAFTAEDLAGTEAITETVFYKALTTHTSGGGNPTPPGNITDWTEALTFTGTNLTLTSSSSFFDAGHVGALFKITHPRKDSGISGNFTAIGSSQFIRLSKGTTWSFTSSGTWQGTFEIQRSYDDGATTEIVKIFSSGASPNGRNVATSGEELLGGALYRITVTNFVSGNFIYDFNADEFSTDGIVEITAFASSTSVTATVIEALGNVLATDNWCEGAWSDFRGWPRAVSFFDNRLFYAGTAHLPTTYWYSNSDDFDNFQAGSDDNQSSPRRLDGDQINQIQWISSLEDVVIGTAGSNWRVSSNDRSSPLGPANITHRQQNSSGTDATRPAIINNAFLYVCYRGCRVNELIFDEQIQGFSTRDLNIISSHLLEEDTIVELAVMTEPLSIVFARRSDGVLLALHYKREEEQLGWSRVETSGVIKSIAVIPGSVEDELWMIVQRTVSGTDETYVERMKPVKYGSDHTGAWFVDSALESDFGAAVAIDSVTNANPGVVTSTAHGLSTADHVRIENSLGMTELNGVWKVVVLGVNDYTLENPDTLTTIDSTAWGVHTASTGVGEKVAITFTGLGHLEGLTVRPFVDGAPSTVKTVSSASITLSEYSNRTIIGLPYEGELEPMPPDFDGGVLTGRLIHISKVIIHFFNTVGAQISRSDGVFEDIVFTDSDMILDRSTPPKEVSYSHDFEGTWNRENNIKIKQVLPLPQKIGSIVYQVESGGL